jgi:[acyl-carrier-protein] S-malonyltransferase
MTVAFLAPGQGSRDLVYVIDFARNLPRGKQWLDHAADVIELPMTRWLEQGGRHLETTEVVQPVLTAISLVLADELAERGISPEYVAGHSLGEIAAAAIAGWCSFANAISLAGLRGRLMSRQAKRRPGGLLALFDKTDVERALRIGNDAGWVEFGAENAPDEVVLSGDDAALRAIASVCPSRRLSVMGPWHSSAMAEAVEEFRNALMAGERHPLTRRIVLNRDGCLLDAEINLPTYLAEQLTRPVRWSKTLETLHQFGVTDFITLGPGAILRSLVRKNLPSEIRVWHTDGEAALRSLAELRGGL